MTNPPTPLQVVDARAQREEQAHTAMQPKTSLQDLPYRRGQIWIVHENTDNPAVGTELWSNRPAVIVSNDVNNRRSGFVEIVYLTTSTRKRSSPMHIQLGSPLQDGKQSMALCEQVHTVDVSRLHRRKGVLGHNVMAQIGEALAISLDIEGISSTNATFKKWDNHVRSYGIDIAEEIRALSATTTDARVEELTQIVKNLAAERDAWRTIAEANTSRDAQAEALQKILQEQNSNHPHLSGPNTNVA